MKRMLSHLITFVQPRGKNYPSQVARPHTFSHVTTSQPHYLTTSPPHHLAASPPHNCYLLDRTLSLSCEPKYAKCRNSSSTQTSMRTSCKLRVTKAGGPGTRTSERIPTQRTTHHSISLSRPSVARRYRRNRDSRHSGRPSMHYRRLSGIHACKFRCPHLTNGPHIGQTKGSSEVE